jgi:hypothetical protein
MQKIILALACVVQGTAAASSCPLPGAETAEVSFCVCRALVARTACTTTSTHAAAPPASAMPPHPLRPRCLRLSKSPVARDMKRAVVKAEGVA